MSPPEMHYMPAASILDECLRLPLLRAAQPDLVLRSFGRLADWQAWFGENNASDRGVTDAMVRQAQVLGLSSLHLGHVLPSEVEVRERPSHSDIVVGGLAARHRSMLDLIAALELTARPEEARIYAAEAVTPWARAMRGRYPRFIGSEYCPDPAAADRLYPIEHQDLARLGYPNESFDLVVTQEVIEHLPHLFAALSEMARVTRPGGIMLSSMPWHYFSEETLYKARLVDGEVQLLGEPEYHDDPVNPAGVLVFQLPGWDILKMAQAAGFSSAEFLFHSSTIGGIHGQDVIGVFVLACRK